MLQGTSAHHQALAPDWVAVEVHPARPACPGALCACPGKQGARAVLSLLARVAIVRPSKIGNRFPRYLKKGGGFPSVRFPKFFLTWEVH